MKKILFFTTMLVGVIIIIQLLTTIYTLWHKQDLLTQARQQLQREQTEHARLQQQLHQVTAPSFIEEEARNKLFLVKPGEQEVFIAQGADGSSKKQDNQKTNQPNWLQWLGIFFH